MEFPAVISTSPRRAAAMALALLFTGSPACRADERPPAPRGPSSEIGHAKETTMQWPTWTQLPQSPAVDKPGVKVALGATVFQAGEPVAMYGTYVVDGAFYAKCFGEVSPWITVIAIARDMPGAWIKPVLEKPMSVPIPTTPWPVPNPSFIQRGFFNLDLREHLQLPNRPSRYWLLVAMGDHFSDRLSFEIR